MPCLALALMFLVTACQKNGAAPITSFAFQLDTVLYTLPGGDATILDTLGQKALQVRGVTNNFAQNVILLVKLGNATPQPGNYYGTMIFADSILLSDYASTWISDSVRVNLSAIDGKQATGTFSGELFQNEKFRILSNGTFSVNY
ncbi:hypothetical protein DCM91_06270 [Chitinophaga costaii]|nr:hypothetical protein [Chitinophaga costaii]PUZ27808.1 hypothetical protein DCM91_06270 [Chitinophaga costaii]